MVIYSHETGAYRGIEGETQRIPARRARRRVFRGTRSQHCHRADRAFARAAWYSNPQTRIRIPDAEQSSFAENNPTQNRRARTLLEERQSHR